MTLIKYNPRNFSTQGVNRFFDNFFNDDFSYGNGLSESKSFVPQVDISESEEAFEIQFAVPGIKKEDFTLEINDGRLTVNGERKINEEKNEKNFHSIETKYGSFSRSFQLPDNINEEKIGAEYKDGILNVSVPKDEKKVLKRSISVK